MVPELKHQIETIVGPLFVCDEDFARVAYAKDYSANDARIPALVVRPQNTEQIQKIVMVANETKTPIIPRGGGTQYGGLPPAETSICIDITRMNAIVDVNRKNRTVTVEAGITGAELEQRLMLEGLYTHTTYSPSASVTVGGSLCGAFGGGGRMFAGQMNWPTILGIKAVLPNGTVIETGSKSNRHASMFSRASIGPDMTGLFIGSMGVMGIVTEVTQELYPYPAYQVHCSGEYQPERFTSALQNIIALGIQQPPLLALGMMSISFHDHQIRSVTLLMQTCDEQKHEAQRKMDQAKTICENVAKPDSWNQSPQMQDKFLRFPQDSSNSQEKFKGMTSLSEFLIPFDKGQQCIQQLIDKANQLTSDKNHGITFCACHIFLCGKQLYTTFVFLHKQKEVQVKQQALNIISKLDHAGMQLGAMKMVLSHDSFQLCNNYMQVPYRRFLMDIKKSLDPNNIMNPSVYSKL